MSIDPGLLLQLTATIPVLLLHLSLSECSHTDSLHPLAPLTPKPCRSSTLPLLFSVSTCQMSRRSCCLLVSIPADVIVCGLSLLWYLTPG